MSGGVNMPKPGEHWVDRRQMPGRKELRDRGRYRRCIEVIEAIDGLVRGLSYWQEKRAEQWYPVRDPLPRKTTIFAHIFERRFVQIESAADRPALPDQIRRQFDAVEGGCWPWRRPKSHGYGEVKVDGRWLRAHRLVYELLVGPIPSGFDIDHICHNRDATCDRRSDCPHRRCVNPAHLEPVPHRTNVLRGRTVVSEMAARTHCKQGHPFAGDNLKVRANGVRVCRTCTRAAKRAAKARSRLKAGV